MVTLELVTQRAVESLKYSNFNFTVCIFTISSSISQLAELVVFLTRNLVQILVDTNLKFVWKLINNEFWCNFRDDVESIFWKRKNFYQ